MSDLLITFFASFLIFILFAGLFVLWVVDGKIKKEQVIHAFFACFIAWLTAETIKIFFPTLRSFLLNGQNPLTLTIPNDGAFPSSHTALAFALGVTIFMHDKKYGFLYLLGAILIGVARVAANVHYPLDILAGAFLGTLIAVVVEKVHPRLTISRR